MSDLMGMSKHAIQSVTLKQEPIRNIKVFRKSNDGYMRGCKITYRNGQTDLINSEDGLEAGTIEVEDNEVLVGITLACSSESDRRPRRLGFTFMKSSGSQQLMSNAAAMSIGAGAGGYMVQETKPIGNEFRLEQTWPSIQSL